MSVSTVRPRRNAPLSVRAMLVASFITLSAALLATSAVSPVRASVYHGERGPGPDPTRSSLPEGVLVATDGSAGVAVLHGRVTRPIERLFASRAVRARADVRHVIDALIVSPATDPATARANDAVEAGIAGVGTDHVAARDARRNGR